MQNQNQTSNNNFVYIETYGCSANQNNSEILAGILTQNHYQITNNEKIADIIIINTCIVKGKTENKIKRRIQDLEKTKKLIIVAGCMPETNSEDIKQLNKNTILLGTHHFKDIANLISDYKNNQLTKQIQQEYLQYRDEEKIILPKIPHNKLISIIQISEGCNGNCTYCKTKFAKGKLSSYDENKIIKQAESDLQQGAKEIWLTSQDCASYGTDKYNSRLVELLNSLLSLNHRFKLRLGMMNPNNLLPIIDELIEIYNHKKIYKFVHIPIQSASNKILKDMNRKYTIEQAEQIINNFKKQIPNITIATDLIVGYPTEENKDFEINLNFINKIKPDVLNLSKFSNHKELNLNFKPINQEIISDRTEKLMNVHRKTALENKNKFLNKIIEVFVNKKIENNLYEARDNNYNIILVNSKEKILGKTIKAKIKSLGVHHMLGEVI